MLKYQRSRGLVGLFAVLLGWTLVAQAAESSKSHKQSMEIFGEGTIWRFHVTLRPPLVGVGGEARELDLPSNPWVKSGEDLCSPLPPSDWRRIGFDDSGWPRGRAPFYGGYGDERPKGPALLCARGRFRVADLSEVEDLALSVRYRGGVAVYLNGREVARGHLSAGDTVSSKLDPLTPAMDYPRELFVTPSGRSLLRSYGRRKPPADLEDRYDGRIRSLDVRVPRARLQSGTNVLALEIHRAPLPPDLPTGRGEPWDTLGLCSIRMTHGTSRGVVPAVRAPEGIQVWNADPLLPVGGEVSYGDPLEPLRPIRMTAPRNGVASGQVVVSGLEEKTALEATMVDLRLVGSQVGIPVRLRYARLGEDFVPLLDRPPEGRTIQPIWLTAKVPDEAHAGVYRGELTLSAAREEWNVPVELTVHGWRIPDPRDWRTCVNLLQSPESVAGRYGVRLWSDEHFRLIGRTFELMAECGNDILGISLVGKSVFGNDPLLVFRRKGGGFEPELGFARRYLTLYDRIVGEPRFLSLHVWSYGMSQRGFGRDGGDEKWRAETIPVAVLEGDEVVTSEAPIYGKPGTEGVWKKVLGGLQDIVRKLGWREDVFLFGTGGDCWPDEETVAFFQKLLPGTPWRVLTHGSGAPKWGLTDFERTQPNGMVVGYVEMARRIRNKRTRLDGYPITCNARDLIRSDPFGLRSLTVTNRVNANFDGFCWKGLDYWTYPTAAGKTRSALNTYVHFGNMVGGTPRTLAGPGPEGAVSTVQLEMLRAGIQDCEAILSIRENLDVLYPRPVRKLDAATLVLKNALVREPKDDKEKAAGIRTSDLEVTVGCDPNGEAILLRTKAALFGGGKHDSTLRSDTTSSLTRMDFNVTVEPNRWNPGGSGEFRVRLQRDGNRLTGKYEGKWQGRNRSGMAEGVLAPRSLVQPVEAAPVDNELTRRCDAVIKRVSSMFLTGLTRASPQGGVDVRRHVADLHALAAELAEKAAAIPLRAEDPASPSDPGRARPRLIVSSDIGGSDPDDFQSLVHLLVYADALDIEGLISSPPGKGRVRHIIETIDVYEKDWPRLKRHGEYPLPDSLRKVTKQGAVEAAPPAGFSTPTEGSRWIIERAHAEDRRRLWVLVWGSITDVAQAVHDAPEIKQKIRVYSIGSWNTRQDPAARDYLAKRHPDLWWIESDTTFRGMYIGGVQRGEWGNRAFIRENVSGHGALGDFLAEKKDDIKMGDTPSVLYLLHGVSENPGGPSWGGSYVLKPGSSTHWMDDPSTEQAEGNRPGARTVNRWRIDYLSDWKRRMDRALPSPLPRTQG